MVNGRRTRGKMSNRDRPLSTTLVAVFRSAVNLAPSTAIEKYAGEPNSGLSDRWAETFGVPPRTVDCVVP